MFINGVVFPKTISKFPNPGEILLVLTVPTFAVVAVKLFVDTFPKLALPVTLNVPLTFAPKVLTLNLLVAFPAIKKLMFPPAASVMLLLPLEMFVMLDILGDIMPPESVASPVAIIVQAPMLLENKSTAVRLVPAPIAMLASCISVLVDVILLLLNVA